MHNKRAVVIIILLLLVITSFGTYVYVQREPSTGINEQAEASEIRQSDLEVLERQLSSNNLEANPPSADIAENEEVPNDRLQEEQNDSDSDGIGSDGLSSPTSASDVNTAIDPSIAPEGFQNRKAPEITNEAAQTTVNLTVTNPDNITRED